MSRFTFRNFTLVSKSCTKWCVIEATTAQWAFAMACKQYPGIEWEVPASK